MSAAAARQTGWLRVALEGGLLRTSTDTVTREAFGSPDAFSVRRTVESQTSADRTHLRARFSEPSPEDGDTSPRFFAAAGWERDAPAGVRSRYDLTVGVGTAWGRTRAGGRRPFETSLGLSAIHQRDEVADPGVETASLGLRLDVRAETRYPLRRPRPGLRFDLEPAEHRRPPSGRHKLGGASAVAAARLPHQRADAVRFASLAGAAEACFRRPDSLRRAPWSHPAGALTSSSSPPW